MKPVVVVLKAGMKSGEDLVHNNSPVKCDACSGYIPEMCLLLGWFTFTMEVTASGIRYC